jgi:hypothetical protein
MAEAPARTGDRARTHWALRLADALPFSPGWLGVAVTSAGLALFSGLAWSLGWVDGLRFQGELFWRTLQFRLELLNAVVLGVLPVAMAMLLRGARRDLRELAPALGLDPGGLAVEQAAIVRFRSGTLLAVSLAGSLAGIAIALDPGNWLGGRPALGDPLLLWVLARQMLLFALLAQTAWLDVILAHRLSRLGERVGTVDLLDLAPLRAFGRSGLRSVSLWMLGSALAALFLLLPFSSHPALFILVLIFAVAVVALLLPALGVHRRLAERKQRELERARDAIRAESEALLAAPAAPGRSPGRLADLLAWEARLDGASTWPFDASTLLRFALYVSLGLGSWLGGAAVERILDLALG